MWVAWRLMLNELTVELTVEAKEGVSIIHPQTEHGIFILFSWNSDQGPLEGKDCLYFICKIREAIWLVLCLLATGWRKDSVYLVCFRSVETNTYTLSFPSPRSSPPAHAPLPSRSEHWGKGKQGEASLKEGWQCHSRSLSPACEHLSYKTPGLSLACARRILKKAMLLIIYWKCK